MICQIPASISLKNNRVIGAEPFPVTYSTLACDALHSRVLSAYDIAPVTNIQLWHRGLSDVYLVETRSKPYILRVSHAHWRQRSDIDFELDLLVFLHQHQIPVANPLVTRNGQVAIEINAPEGIRYASLFKYAPGQVPLGDLNPSQSHLLGATVAKIHKSSEHFRSHSHRQPLTLDYLLDDSLADIAPFLYQRSADLTYLKNTISRIKEELTGLPQTFPYWVVCWGDPHSGNVHFTSDNQLTLFDFDQCGYGWRAFEIAKFLQVSLRTGLECQTRNAFLDGYQAIQALTQMELDRLQPLTQAAHIWMWSISLTHAKLHNSCVLDKRYFTHRLSQLKLLDSRDWQLF